MALQCVKFEKNYGRKRDLQPIILLLMIALEPSKRCRESDLLPRPLNDKDSYRVRQKTSSDELNVTVSRHEYMIRFLGIAILSDSRCIFEG